MTSEADMEQEFTVKVETVTYNAAAKMATTIGYQVLSILSRLQKKSVIEAEIVKDENLQVLTLDEVSLHDQEDDCWMIIYDRVYDVTNFLNKHPGGEFVMLDYAGRDATLAFRGSHPESAEQALKPYLIGILHESERVW